MAKLKVYEKKSTSKNKEIRMEIKPKTLDKDKKKT